MNATQFIPIIRWANLILIISAAITWFYVYIKSREPGFIAPITWLFNVAAFYLYRFAVLEHQTKLEIDLINLWSSVIITHGIILLILIVWVIDKERYYLIVQGRRKEWK